MSADTKRSDQLLTQAGEALLHTGPLPEGSRPLLCGVDLGTASIVLVVLGEDQIPIACEMECSQVVKDGLVVDYFGATRIVQRLKEQLEQRLGVELTQAAIAVPPGTSHADCGTHRHVVEACGMDVTAVVDEPTAANAVLGIENGVVVDVGGGTTGLSVFRDGKMVYTADEATGGLHVSLVLMGGYKIDFDEAEQLKRDPKRAAEVLGAVRPVIQKMASIVGRHIQAFEVDNICLVGGTCRLPGVEDIFTKELGIPVWKPSDPMLVTPLGIAMSCGQ